jgi:hypothetical protein
MLLRRCLFVIVVLAVALLPIRAAENPALPDGNYLLKMQQTQTFESRIAIIKAETKDGKLSMEVLATPPAPKAPAGQPARPVQKVTIGEAKIEKGLLRFPIEMGPSKYTFEGVILTESPKELLGSMEARTLVYPATLSATDLNKFEADAEGLVAMKLTDDLTELRKLRSEPARLQAQARSEKDTDKRKELLDQAKAAKKEADEKVPGLLTKVVDSNLGTMIGYFSTFDLLPVAEKSKATAADVTKWTTQAIEFAKKHGPRFEQFAIGQVANGLASQAQFAAVALPFAEKHAANLAKAAPADKLKALVTLATIQAASGKADAAKQTQAEIAVIDASLDAEYKKTVPPFTPEKYAGRTDREANRVAVLELFTGAQCPPCVAADVAFDALESSYATKDVVLIQYHMHIPGPDPLTNKDTLTRWDYYGKLFPEEIRGVPSSLFNGKPAAGGGGGMANSKSKYDQYKKLIDPVLETKSDLKIDGSAVLAEGGITVNATIGGVNKPSDKVTVRVLLTEDEVKYPGGNGIRFHHMVVRSAFGKVDGWNLNETNGKITATIKLDELKKDLSTYLDEFAKDRAFNPPTRPMELKQMKVILFVQDDATGEILQGAQFDLKAGKS